MKSFMYSYSAKAWRAIERAIGMDYCEHTYYSVTLNEKQKAALDTTRKSFDEAFERMSVFFQLMEQEQGRSRQKMWRD